MSRALLRLLSGFVLTRLLRAALEARLARLEERWAADFVHGMGRLMRRLPRSHSPATGQS